MTNRDRKDLPHPHEEQMVPALETHTDRVARKEKESDALDQALEETFPTSDPISPFVPAVPVEVPTPDSALAKRACARDGCQCEVSVPEKWCTNHCREAQQGYIDTSKRSCDCGHQQCTEMLPASVET